MSLKLKRAALAACATLLCLLAAELFLRLAAPESVFVLDDTYLHGLRPNSEQVFKHADSNGGSEVPERINGRGFRGAEFTSERAKAKRVMVYGDSFVEAPFTTFERTLPKRLEQLLNERRGEAVEVVNAGVRGYGPDQISLRLDAELDEFRPDLVVVAVYSGNDFGDLIRNKIYTLDERGELVKRNYFIGTSLRKEVEARPRSALLARLRETVSTLKAAASGQRAETARPDGAAFFERSVRRCREQYADYLQSDEVRDLFRDQYDADIAFRIEPEAARYKKRLMEQVLLKIKRTLDARGTPLVLLIIPTASDSVPGYELSVDRNVYKDYEPTALTSAIEEIAARNQIPHFNLFDAFTAADPSRLYFKFPDAHWNDDGQELAARTLVEFINSAGLLQRAAGSAARTTLRPSTR